MDNSLIPVYTVILAALITGQQNSRVAANDNLRVVAVSGQKAPGTNAGVLFNRFTVPTMNSGGQIAFRAELVGADVSQLNGVSIYRYDRERGATLMAREGSLLTPSSGDHTIAFISGLPTINDVGQIAFHANLSNTIDSDRSPLNVILRVSESNQEVIAGESDPVPVLGSDVRVFGINSRSLPTLNNAGESAVVVTVRGSNSLFGDAETVLLDGGDSGQRIDGVESFHAPGTPGGFRSFGQPVVNGSGETAFFSELFATIGDNFTNSRNNIALFRRTAGRQLFKVARLGEPVPGLEEGVIFSGFGTDRFRPFLPPAFNHQGELAFYGEVDGPTVGEADQVLFSSLFGNPLQVIARRGDPAPHAGINATFGRLNFFSQLVLNSEGHAAFLAELTGEGIDDSNDGVIYAESVTGLRLVAREGQLAPETEPGTHFLELQGVNLIDGLLFNGRGQAAFAAGLGGPEVDDSSDFGIFAEDLAGNLRLIARTGEEINVSDDPLAPDWRQIDFLSISDRNLAGNGGNEDGRPSAFNDLGQLAFHAQFTDGTSGIFVSDLVAIPEPTSFVMVAIGAVGLLWRRVN